MISAAVFRHCRRIDSAPVSGNEARMENNQHPGPFRAEKTIILGSASPRRRELLENLGIEFSVAPSDADEPSPEAGESPAAYAVRMAEAKAHEVAGRHSEAVVIGSDTVVALEGEIMGKPVDDTDALRMLTALSGQTHQVVTGVAVVFPDRDPVTFAAETEVCMRSSSREELLSYIATGEPGDKAGAYAIQGIGTFLVTEISGSYTNVVGLPLAELLDVLLKYDVLTSR